MKKIWIYSLLILINSCFKLPQREEIEYRNHLEDAIVKTFPKKVSVVIHPFRDRSGSGTFRSYLSDAIPDTLESVLESLRTTLAYVPFNGMPFYVSKDISQLLNSLRTNLDTNNMTNKNTDDIYHSSDNITNTINDRDDKKFFVYLTNYLILIPKEEEQFSYSLRTNTNYFTVLTNSYFENGIPLTNYTSNEILSTTTNQVKTNIVTVQKALLSTTNMLLLIYEEYPELINYLSFLPIEVRRASEIDTSNLVTLQEKLSNPKKWAEKRRILLEEKEKEKSKDTNYIKSIFPEEEFSYTYHIIGTYNNIRSKNTTTLPIETEINIQIYPPDSTGNDWWHDTYNEPPTSLNKILELEKSFSTNNTKDQKNTLHKKLYLRTPFTKPKLSARLQSEFDDASSNFRDNRPDIPTINSPLITNPKNIYIRATENEIPIKLINSLKDFHATIINRPYTDVKVTTIPEDCLVYLNGFYIGITPLIYPTAPLGKQRMAFVKEGFNREEILVDILPNQTNIIDYSLTALNISGSVTLTASKPVEVYINTKFKGITPITVSNLMLEEKYRIEFLDPKANLTADRKSVYKTIVLTENKPHVNFDAHFKTYETKYRTPAQKMLLGATYLSWITTVAILGGGIYTQARAKEYAALANLPGLGAKDPDLQEIYRKESIKYTTTALTTLYSAIAGAVVSCGIMGWYLYSKEVYLGLDITPGDQQEWYANFKLKFH